MTVPFFRTSTLKSNDKSWSLESLSPNQIVKSSREVSCAGALKGKALHTPIVLKLKRSNTGESLILDDWLEGRVVSRKSLPLEWRKKLEKMKWEYTFGILAANHSNETAIAMPNNARCRRLDVLANDVPRYGVKLCRGGLLSPRGEECQDPPKNERQELLFMANEQT